MALLQQHDARRDIVIEPAARRRAAIEARRAFRTADIRNWGRSELGAQSGRKNPPACLSMCLSATNLFVHAACVRGSVLIRHVYDRPHRLSPGRGFLPLKMHYRPGKGMGVYNEGEVYMLSAIALLLPDFSPNVIKNRTHRHHSFT